MDGGPEGIHYNDEGHGGSQKIIIRDNLDSIKAFLNENGDCLRIAILEKELNRKKLTNYN